MAVIYASNIEKADDNFNIGSVGINVKSVFMKYYNGDIAKNLMDILSIEMIAKKTGLSIEEVEKLKADMSKS